MTPQSGPRSDPPASGPAGADGGDGAADADGPAGPDGLTAPAAGRIVVSLDAELAELIDEYLANRRADVHTIADLLAAGDYEAIWGRGHNMKGVGAAYGFDYLTDLGAELEAAARRQDDGEVRRCLASLEDYLDRLDVRFEEA
jgi:HPt (histidine-containing phosphotransfer) domain-containing protein